MNRCATNRRTLAAQFKRHRTAFVALGDEARQRILLAILENERVGMRVPEITEKVSLSRPAVSHHLKILKEAGFVNVRRVATKNYYFVDDSEGRWHDLKEFFDQIDSVIKMGARAGYPLWDDERGE